MDESSFLPLRRFSVIKLFLQHSLRSYTINWLFCYSSTFPCARVCWSFCTARLYMLSFYVFVQHEVIWVDGAPLTKKPWLAWGSATWHVDLVLFYSALLWYFSLINSIELVSLFSSQDTIAIKKRSSRTRRIRPVSTRLSEYRCISSHPPLSPRFLLSSDPILSFSRLH